jgi:predicted Zn-dependent peptidase
MSTASLKTISRADLAAFHGAYLLPSNTMIAVSGDLSREEAVAAIQKYFGQWRSTGKKLTLAPPPVNPASGFFIMNKPLPQSTFVSGELTVGKNDPDYYAFSILDFIIGSGGFRSRIFTALRNNEGLAYSAGSFYRARPLYGVFGTYAFTKTESTYQAMRLTSSILKEIAAGSITEDELTWAKKSILNGFIFSFEYPAQIVNQQMTVAFELLPDDYLSGYRKRIETVSRDDLKRVAAKYLREKKRLTLILGDTEKFGKLPDSWNKPTLVKPQP